MVQELTSQPSIFGRLGQGLARGIAETVPKEVERRRLSEGLENVSQESANLTPFQKYAKLVGVAHEYPQVVQSGEQLLRQEGTRNALVKRPTKLQTANQPTPNQPNRPTHNQPTPNQPNQPGQPAKKHSITTTAPTQAELRPVLPMTYDEKLQLAGELLDQDPELYQNDPSLAMKAVDQIDENNQLRNKALVAQGAAQRGVQDRIENEFVKRAKSLGVENIPGDSFNELRDKALYDVDNGILTEKEAADKYGKEADEISRKYKALDTLGRGLFNSSENNRKSLQSVRNDFKDRNDLRNFRKSVIGRNGLSPSKASLLTYPISDIKALNNDFAKLSNLKIKRRGAPASFNAVQETARIAPQLAKSMGQQGSPMSIGEELKARGYDPETWMDYVRTNRKSLNLAENQSDELDEPNSWMPYLADIWLGSMTGIDKLSEQE